MDRTAYSSNPTLADIPMLKAVNTLVRRVLVDRYGGDLNAQPARFFSVDDRTLEAIIRHHPHPAARAMAAHFLRTGDRIGSGGIGDRVALPLPPGGALTLAKSCFVATEVVGQAGRSMLDDGLSIQQAILDAYDVTDDEIRRGMSTAVAA